MKNEVEGKSIRMISIPYCIYRSVKTYGVITEKAKRSKESRSACIGGYDYEIKYRNEFVCGSEQNGIYI